MRGYLEIVTLKEHIEYKKSKAKRSVIYLFQKKGKLIVKRLMLLKIIKRQEILKGYRLLCAELISHMINILLCLSAIFWHVIPVPVEMRQQIMYEIYFIIEKPVLKKVILHQTLQIVLQNHKQSVLYNNEETF